MSEWSLRWSGTNRKNPKRLYSRLLRCLIIPDILSKQKSVPLMGMSGIDRYHFCRERITRSRLALTSLFRPETEWNLGKKVRVSQQTAKSGVIGKQWQPPGLIPKNEIRNHIIDGRHPRSSGVRSGTTRWSQERFYFPDASTFPDGVALFFLTKVRARGEPLPASFWVFVGQAETLKIARMTSTHWPHQHFKQFSSPQQRVI